MKLGFDAYKYFKNKTGLGNYSRTLLSNLIHHFPTNEYLLYTSKIKHPEFYTAAKNSGLDIKTKNSFSETYWRSYGISHHLTSDNIELYHGLCNELPFNIKESKAKSIVTIHDLIFKILPDTYPLLERNIFNYKFRKSCANADRIIAISENTKNDLINIYGISPDKIQVIYQACNALYYDDTITLSKEELQHKYAIPSEYILFVGTIEKRKNLQLLLDSYKLLKPTEQVPLVIIGNGKKYVNEYLTAIKNNGLENKIIWLRNVEDNTHLKSFYANALLFVYPSLYEGFGLPVAEALLSKTPVITSKSSSLAEAGGPDTIYINPNNKEELAVAISSVLTDTTLRNKMVENGLSYAKGQFSAQKLSTQLHDVYQKTLIR